MNEMETLKRDDSWDKNKATSDKGRYLAMYSNDQSLSPKLFLGSSVPSRPFNWEFRICLRCIQCHPRSYFNSVRNKIVSLETSTTAFAFVTSPHSSADEYVENCSYSQFKSSLRISSLLPLFTQNTRPTWDHPDPSPTLWLWSLN